MADDGNEGRLLLAGIWGPAAGAAWGAISFVVGAAIAGAPFVILIAFLVAAFVYGIVIAMVLTWTVGLAWHALATAANWRSAWAYMATATAVGFALACAIPRNTMPAVSDTPLSVAWVVSCSMVVAWVGWSIRRPDRDTPNPPTAAP